MEITEIPPVMCAASGCRDRALSGGNLCPEHSAIGEHFVAAVTARRPSRAFDGYLPHRKSIRGLPSG